MIRCYLLGVVTRYDGYSPRSWFKNMTRKMDVKIYIKPHINHKNKISMLFIWRNAKQRISNIIMVAYDYDALPMLVYSMSYSSACRGLVLFMMCLVSDQIRIRWDRYRLLNFLGSRCHQKIIPVFTSPSRDSHLNTIETVTLPSIHSYTSNQTHP